MNYTAKNDISNQYKTTDTLALLYLSFYKKKHESMYAYLCSIFLF